MRSTGIKSYKDESSEKAISTIVKSALELPKNKNEVDWGDVLKKDVYLEKQIKDLHQEISVLSGDVFEMKTALFTLQKSFDEFKRLLEKLLITNLPG